MFTSKTQSFKLPLETYHIHDSYSTSNVKRKEENFLFKVLLQNWVITDEAFKDQAEKLQRIKQRVP